MLSYYEILQINENASDAEVKSAYRKLCKILHPDLHNNTKEANVIFRLLHDAYETLSDPVKKRNYNPKHNSNSSYGISSEKYDEIITGYKKIVKDYERIIKSKDSREKELLEEIRNLEKASYVKPTQEEKTIIDYERIIKLKNSREKELLEEIRNLKNGTNPKPRQGEEFHEQEIRENTKQNEPKQQEKGLSTWEIVFYIALIIIIILILMIPLGWWIIIGIVVVPIWLIVSVFRKL